MTFRTPAEAVELANNTVYGLAACIWSENINVALDVASQVKAGVVWVNCTNHFDAACGFGGYRESGYGREGGREGMYEYLTPNGCTRCRQRPQSSDRLKRRMKKKDPRRSRTAAATYRPHGQAIHRRQAGAPRFRLLLPRLRARRRAARRSAARQPQRHSQRRRSRAQRRGLGQNRGAHPRAGPLLHRRKPDPAPRRDRAPPRAAVGEEQAAIEVDLSIERIFTYAAWADKYDGLVHNPPGRNVTIAMNEAVGAIGILAPTEAPLLGLLSLVLPAIAVGNTVVAVPSRSYPLIIGDLYQLFDTSDLPGGVVNLVAGRPAELGKTLAEHDGIDAIWCFR